MDFFSAKYIIWAVALGGLSAVSLPLGSLVGLRTRPRPGLISVMAAFGAGALIAALTVELVAPTLFALEEVHGASSGGSHHRNFYALVSGAVLGGVIFVVLDHMVNSRGGYLRRTSTTIAHFTAARRKKQQGLLGELCGFPLLKDLAPEHVNTLVTMVRPVRYNPGEVIAKPGDAAKELIFITGGAVDAETLAGLKATFDAGQAVGVLPLIMGVPNPGSLTAVDQVQGMSLSAGDFQRLQELCPQFDEAVRELARQRMEHAETLIAARDEQAIQWLRQAGHALKTGAEIPDALALQQAKEEHKGAPLAIWLGILIDGIPESFVIGAGLLAMLQTSELPVAELTFAGIIPFTLIAGLFLSNFPEALASSANMRQQGWSKVKIFFLWFVLMIITALGAGVGFMLADSLSHTFLIGTEGLAAGAMLTMIAAAMIPEAVHMGKANQVGLATLVGFIAAISFKLLE